VFIIRRSKLYYTASGIITLCWWPSRAQVHGTATETILRCTVSKTSTFPGSVYKVPVLIKAFPDFWNADQYLPPLDMKCRNYVTLTFSLVPTSHSTITVMLVPGSKNLIPSAPKPHVSKAQAIHPELINTTSLAPRNDYLSWRDIMHWCTVTLRNNVCRMCLCRHVLSSQPIHRPVHAIPLLLRSGHLPTPYRWMQQIQAA